MEPEVYETPDVAAEPSLPLEKAEEAAENPNIASAPVDPAEARRKFQGVTGKRSYVPRSGILDGQFLYEIISVEEEEEAAAGGGRKQETALQKYRRLQFEVAELSKQLATEVESKTEFVEQEVTAKELWTQVESLGSELQRLGVVVPLGKEGAGSTTTQTEAFIGQLSKTLDNFRTTAEKAPSTEDQQSSPSSVTYELYYNGSLSKDKKESTLTQLETRINLLEQLLGQKQLLGNTGISSVPEAIVALERKIALLDPAQLDTIVRKAKYVQLEVNKLTEGKKFTPTSEMETKIETLYEKMDRWDSVTETVPLLVERLKSLSRLHQEAAVFADSLTVISNEQTNISTQLKTLGPVLSQLENTFAENNKSLQTNVEILNKRIEAVLQKLATLQ